MKFLGNLVVDLTLYHYYSIKKYGKGLTTPEYGNCFIVSLQFVETY